MQSTQPNSEEPLDDDAILTLFQYAGWHCEFSDDDQMWLVYPKGHIIGALFGTLQEALEYFLMCRRQDVA